MTHLHLSSLKKNAASYYINKAIKNSSQLITVSEYSKKELIKYFNPSIPINVIYNGMRSPLEFTNDYLNTYSYPYILYVGNLKPSKNVIGMLEIFKEYKKKYQQNIHFIIAGDGDNKYKQQLNHYVSENNLNDYIHLIGYKSEDELAWLYKNALLYLFLSKFEGFGYTPLEAMSYSTPVICSNRTSLPEVIGEGGILVDPGDINNILSLIYKVIYNKNYRDDIIKKGLSNITRFSLEKSGEKHYNLILSVAE